MKYLVYTTGKPPGLLRKTAAVIATAGLVGLGLMFSAILIPIILAIIAAAWGYLWWKTRDLRRQLRQMQNFPPSGKGAASRVYREDASFKGEIIEGEATRVDDTAGKIGH